MKALVLGGTGFIGSYVVDRLLASGHKVRVLSRSPERFRPPSKEVDYRLANFNDIPALVEAVDGVDVVFHLISTTVPSTSNKAPVFDIESNLIGTVNLLRIMNEAKERPRLVYLSSGGTVYGVPEILPIPETHPLRPICSYGVVKVAVENYLHMFHELYGLEYVVLRPSNPFGDRQGHYGVQGFIGTILNKIQSGNSIDVWGDGTLVRDFVYVVDLAKLCVIAAESNKIGIYNAGSGKGHSIKEVLGLIENVVGKQLAVNWMESRNFDVPHVVLNIEKTISDFDWRPEVDLGGGIGKAWEMHERVEGKNN